MAAGVGGAEAVVHARRALLFAAIVPRRALKSAASVGAEVGLVKRKVTPTAGREEGGVKVTLRLCLPEAGGEEKRAGGRTRREKGGRVEVSSRMA